MYDKRENLNNLIKKDNIKYIFEKKQTIDNIIVSTNKINENLNDCGYENFFNDCLLIMKSKKKKKKILLNYKNQEDILDYCNEFFSLMLKNYWDNKLSNDIKKLYNDKNKKGYTWISYYKEGPPGFCNEEMDTGDIFLTREEAEKDAELNSRRKFDNSYYPRIFKGYKIQEIDFKDKNIKIS